jgi:3'-5' exoribonuclease
MGQEINKDVEEIRKIAKDLGDDALEISSEILNDPNFGLWTGSLEHKHHYGKGGLAKHTLEVIKLAFNAKETLFLQIDPKELFFACLFHDIGKLWDYQPLDFRYYKDWTGTEHKRVIHHITRSALIWNDTINFYPEYKRKYHEPVLHAILAHHGCREYGSPVSPKSRVAWLLHLCDSISARMDDCQHIDLFS